MKRSLLPMALVVIAILGLAGCPSPVTPTPPDSAGAGDDATLSSLSMADATLSPAFSSSVTEYSAEVAYSTATADITAIATDASATVQISGAALAPGSNVVTILVTADDATTTKTYTVSVFRRYTELSVTSPVANATVSGTITVSGEYLGQTPDHITVVFPGTATVTATIDGTSWSASVDTTGATNGSKLITVHALTAADEDLDSRVVPVDAQNAGGSAGVSVSGTVAFAGTAQTTGQVVVYLLDGDQNLVAYQLFDLPFADSPQAFALTGVADGTYTLMGGYWAGGNAGNVDPTTLTNYYTDVIVSGSDLSGYVLEFPAE